MYMSFRTGEDHEEEMAKAARVLEEAGNLLSSREKWTKGAYARDEQGIPISSSYLGGCSFCLVGAVSHATRSLYPVESAKGYLASRTIVFLDGVLRLLGSGGQLTTTWNDHPGTTHEMVLNLLQEAKRVLAEQFPATKKENSCEP
jgi:hypothetical protein